MNFARAHLQSTPLAVLHPHELVSEADLLGELLQQVNAKSATALIKAPVLLRRLNIHSATKNKHSQSAGFVSERHPRSEYALALRIFKIFFFFRKMNHTVK